MNKKDAEHIAVFYEGQDDLIDILAVSMASVCYNTKSFVDFYILDCGICDFNKKQLELLKEKFANFSIEYIPIDLKQFEGLKGWRGFLDCYSRLQIPELKKKLNRAIYLDSDVVALGDVKLLWKENLDGHAVGAAAEIGYGNFLFQNCTNKLGISPTHIYLNTGVLLIDCQQWRQKKITQSLFDIARRYKDDIFVICEDILSIYFNDTNYKLLPNRYNLSDRINEIKDICASQITDEYLEEEWKHIVFQHLTPCKPWIMLSNYYNNKALRHCNSFWFFAQMTPFYEGLKNKLSQNLLLSGNQLLLNNINFIKENKSSLISKYKLFNIIPLLIIKQKNNCKRYFLFGCIPFLKMKVKKHEK
ncbi:MAG: glycosyltransferase family 8 protein [Alphaproteobacteria bacterium]